MILLRSIQYVLVLLLLVVSNAYEAFSATYAVSCKSPAIEQKIELSSLENFQPIVYLRDCHYELEVYRVTWLPNSWSRVFFSRLNFNRQKGTNTWMLRVYRPFAFWAGAGVAVTAATAGVVGGSLVAMPGSDTKSEPMPKPRPIESKTVPKPKKISAKPKVEVSSHRVEPMSELRPKSGTQSAVGGLPNFRSQKGMGDNVCWLNSVIKFLHAAGSHDPEFQHWLYNHVYHDEDQAEFAGHLRNVIAGLAAKLSSEEMVQLVDEVVASLRRGRADQLGGSGDWILGAGREQMDSHEMLLYFLNHMDFPFFVDFKIKRSRAGSPERQSFSEEKHSILTLALDEKDDKDRFSVQNQIDNFLRSGQNWIEHTDPTKSYMEHIEQEVERAPPTIMLSMKRFTGDDGTLPQRIDGALSDYEEISLKDKARYRLVATINHSGSLTGGHYTASTLEGDTVFLHDDSIVTPSSWESKAHNFYILAYHRID